MSVNSEDFDENTFIENANFALQRLQSEKYVKRRLDTEGDPVEAWALHIPRHVMITIHAYLVQNYESSAIDVDDVFDDMIARLVTGKKNDDATRRQQKGGYGDDFMIGAALIQVASHPGWDRATGSGKVSIFNKVLGDCGYKIVPLE